MAQWGLFLDMTYAGWPTCSQQVMNCRMLDALAKPSMFSSHLYQNMTYPWATLDREDNQRRCV